MTYHPNRLSSTIGGNREMNQLSHIIGHVFQDEIKKCKNRNKNTHKIALILL